MQSAEIRWNPFIVDIDFIEIAGTLHKRHNINSDDGSHMFSIIEGIGNCGDLSMGNSYYSGDLFTFLPIYTIGYADYIPIFYHLEDAEGNIIYDAPNDPTDTGGVVTVDRVSTDAVETGRYDIHGRRIAKPVPGINIIRMSDGSVRKELQ